MGSWQLEVMRMGLYMAFPVGIFHWFNTPGVFTDYVEQVRTEFNLHDDPKVKRQYDAFVEKYNKEIDLSKLREMENKYMD